MIAAVIHKRDPFTPLRASEVTPVMEQGLTLRSYLDGVGITEFSEPTICLRNNEPGC